MTTHETTEPMPREIPAGKTLLAEYGQPRDEYARVTIHATAEAQTFRATIRFEECTPGWEPAGSVLRWGNGWFGVRWTDPVQNTTHGQRYLRTPEGRTKAEAHFEKITGRRLVTSPHSPQG